jgi:hypothetical protein
VVNSLPKNESLIYSINNIPRYGWQNIIMIAMKGLLVLAIILILGLAVSHQEGHQHELDEHGMPKPQIYEGVQPEEKKKPRQQEPYRHPRNHEEQSKTAEKVRNHARTADTDQDGIVTFDEHDLYFKTHLISDYNKGWDDHIQDYYAYLDSDKDGKLTLAEFENLFNEHDDL